MLQPAKVRAESTSFSSIYIRNYSTQDNPLQLTGCKKNPFIFRYSFLKFFSDHEVFFSFPAL